MINPFQEFNWKPEGRDLRAFAQSLMVGFPVIAVVLFLMNWLFKQQLPDLRFFLMLGGIGASVGAICFLSPVIARPLYFVWYALTGAIGIVVANLIICLVFFGIFTPMALVIRLIGRDALRLKPQQGANTFWEDAPDPPRADHYFRQY